MTKIKLGMDAELNGGGIANARVRNVSINFEKGEADVSTRGNSGYRQTVGTLKDCTIECELIVRSDADLTDVRANFESGDPQTMTFTLAGGSLTQQFEIMNVGVSQQLEEGIVASVTLKTTATDDSGSSSG